MRHTIATIAVPISMLASALAPNVLAKMPPPTDAEKLAAAQKAAKTAWQDKVDAYKLCLVQDKIAANQRGKSSQPMLPKGKEPTLASTTMTAPVAAAQGGVIAPPVVEPKGGMVVPPPPTGTPPCTDPGPFTEVTPVASKPIEAAGAHSPPGTAASPPSTMKPASEAPKN